MDYLLKYIIIEVSMYRNRGYGFLKENPTRRKNMSKRVEGKVAIVTGGASGIGKETCLVLAREGAKVVVTDIQEELGKKVVEEIKEMGQEAIFVKHNVVSQEDWVVVVRQTIERFRQIDILVNNAGVSLNKPFEDVTLEEWHRVMEINTDSVFLGCKMVMEYLRKSQGASIVNISSMAGLIGNCGAGPYTASKGAVYSVTKALAHDFAKDGIRVNSVHPGYIATAMTEELFKNPDYRQWFESNTPLPYLGQAEDIANAVLYLASNESKFVTGVALPVDGGIVAG